VTSEVRRQVIRAVLAVTAAGAAITGVEAVRTIADLGGEASVRAAREEDARLRCIEAALADLPDVPTYVEPAEAGAAALSYQLSIALGFGELTFVTDRAEAEQVVAIVPGGDPATCGGSAVVVEAP